MDHFIYQANPTRVVFGWGSFASLADELQRLGVQRALVLSTPGQRALAEQAAAALGARAAGVFAGAQMHVPLACAEAARAEAARVNADGAVALGGGSTTGLGKALALTTGLPVLAVPTTYAGSELTAIYGITEGGLKTTGRDARVRPRVAIYDPALTLALPLDVSVTSLFNAMAHAAEALYAPDTNPLIATMAEEGLRAAATALPALVAEPAGRNARTLALQAAWLCSTVLDATTMGLHHKLCHTLGGSFNLPHAPTHTVVLPHALAYNAVAAPEAMARMARALGVSEPAYVPHAMFELARRLHAPTSLKALGMPEAGLDRAADVAAATPYPNPRALDRSALRALLQHAYEGEQP